MPHLHPQVNICVWVESWIPLAIRHRAKVRASRMGIQLRVQHRRMESPRRESSVLRRNNLVRGHHLRSNLSEFGFHVSTCLLVPGRSPEEESESLFGETIRREQLNGPVPRLERMETACESPARWAENRIQ
jgi:hypothetical protein